jgi:hypothetical protein
MELFFSSYKIWPIELLDLIIGFDNVGEGVGGAEVGGVGGEWPKQCIHM